MSVVTCPKCDHSFDPDYKEPSFEDHWYILLAPGARRICQQRGVPFSPQRLKALLQLGVVQELIEEDAYGQLAEMIFRAMSA